MMKEIRELKLSELSVKQKLGMAMCARTYECGTREAGDANIDFVINMIRDHALGAVWVGPYRREEVMARIKEAADYPILIVTDAESGFAPHVIGMHGALGRTGNLEQAYTFGKLTAIHARQLGYNVVCDPVVDLNGGVRSIGTDPQKVAEIALAEAKGMRDGGVLICAKHFPGGRRVRNIDSHMAEPLSMETAESLAEYALQPYIQLNNAGLLDGIMAGHCKYPNIDPDYPTSLSKKVCDVFRDKGFNGFIITDALIMMGTAAKFGESAGKGLAVDATNLALTWSNNLRSYEALVDTYEKGLITDEHLDAAAQHVLDAQHKVFNLPDVAEITEHDEAVFSCINRDGVFAKCDEGLDASISRDGRHYFVVLTESSVEIDDQGKVDVDTQPKGWYQPAAIMDRLMELFPHSKAVAINQFPSPAQNMNVLEQSVDFDDVIFVTFVITQAYVGPDVLTSRVIAVIEALQITDRVSTVVHFGNPKALEDLVHIPRILAGGPSAESINCTLDVLAGNYPAKGKLTQEIHFQ